MTLIGEQALSECQEKCVGAKCQVKGPHTLHTALVRYYISFEQIGYVRLEWPIEIVEGQ